MGLGIISALSINYPSGGRNTCGVDNFEVAGNNLMWNIPVPHIRN